MKRPEPVDFDKVIKRIKAAGGFDDYPEDKWKDAPAPPEFIGRHPMGPGDRIYSSGPMTVGLMGQDIPQHIIKESYTSSLDAINAFLPNDIIGQWMCEYFSNPNFLRSKTLERDVENTQWIGLQFPADDSLGGNLNSPERKRTDRCLFTPSEI